MRNSINSRSYAFYSDSSIHFSLFGMRGSISSGQFYGVGMAIRLAIFNGFCFFIPHLIGDRTTHILIILRYDKTLGILKTRVKWRIKTKKPNRPSTVQKNYNLFFAFKVFLKCTLTFEEGNVGVKDIFVFLWPPYYTFTFVLETELRFDYHLIVIS